MSETEGRQFIDTNVLIYAHDVSAGDKHLRAEALIKDLWQSRLGCLSTNAANFPTHLRGGLR